MMILTAAVTSNAQTKTATKGSAKNPAETGLSLSSTTSYEAKAATDSSLSISDPLINLLNQRANGSRVSISSSGIVGVPKRAFGFANGRILLRNTSATSSGTSTGTPSVGTGNSLGTIGASGAAIGLNGKSPDAGSTMWGNARNILVTQKTKEQ